MRLGMLSFGLPLAAGLIAVSGTATCSLDASAEAVRSVLPESVAKATAYAEADALRTVKGFGAEAVTVSTATAEAAAEYFPAAAPAACFATATGNATAEFFAESWGICYANATSGTIRHVRARGVRADGIATLDGDGYVRQLLYGRTAFARAFAFGTTDHVGYGDAFAEAQAEGDARLRAGAKAEAVASAEATAQAQYTIGVSGLGGATAKVAAYPSFTVGGVVIHHLDGEAFASASASIDVIERWASQIASAYANAVGYIQHQVGFAGRALALAEASGAADKVGTDAGPLTGKAFAFAEGEASGLFNNGGLQLLTATAEAEAQTTPTATQAEPALAFAFASALARRERGAFGAGEAFAFAGISTVQYNLYPSPMHATTQGVVSTVNYQVLGNEAVATSAATGDGARRHFAAGNAVASAQAFGFNQINDLVHAPQRRTHYLVPIVRVHEVGDENRTVRVA